MKSKGIQIKYIKFLQSFLGADVNQEAFVQIPVSIRYKQLSGSGEAHLLLTLRLKGNLS